MIWEGDMKIDEKILRVLWNVGDNYWTWESQIGHELEIFKFSWSQSQQEINSIYYSSWAWSIQKELIDFTFIKFKLKEIIICIDYYMTLYLKNEKNMSILHNSASSMIGQ